MRSTKPSVYEAGITIRRWETAADDFLAENGLTAAELLPNGTLAIGTWKSGILFLDDTGAWIGRFNEEQGLNSDQVHNLQCDQRGVLWASLENGVTRLETHSPLTVLESPQWSKGAGMEYFL